MRKLLFGVSVLAILFAAAYASLPWLVNALLLPRLSAQAGLDVLELDIGHPGPKHLNIARLHLETALLTLDASNIELSYSARSLRSKRLNDIEVGELALTVLIPEDGGGAPSNEPTGNTGQQASSPTLALDAMLSRIPADRIVVERLEAAVPAVDFASRGSLSLDDAGLEVRLTGISPTIARDLDLTVEMRPTGALQLSLQDPDPLLPSSIQLLGEPDGTELAVQGDFSLTGYGLSLFQKISGMPQGTGAVTGELATSLPWPLAVPPAWQTLAGTAQLNIDGALADPPLVLNDMNAVIELENGELRIRLQGETKYATDGVSITGRFTGGAFSYRDGRISSADPRLTLIATTKDLEGRAEVHAVRATESPLSAELTSTVQLDHEAARIKGKLAATLAADSPALEGEFDFDADLDASSLMDLPGLQAYPVRLDGNFVLLGNLLTSHATLNAGPFTDLPFTVEHNLTNAQGTLTFSHTQTVHEPVLHKLLPGWQVPYDVDGGQLTMNGELNWAEQLRGSIEINPQALHAYYDDYTLINAAGALTFDITDSVVLLEPSRLSVEGFDIGTPVTNVALTVSGTPHRLSVGPISAEVLGGTASIEVFDYVVDTGDAEFSIMLSDLDLSEVLALQGSNVSGSGRLSGIIPVTLHNNSAQVRGGTVSAIDSGHIELSPALAAGITQPGLDIAIRALENFNYEALSANVDYDGEGNMLLGVRLEGSNPDLEGGRPVHFNLNISENIPVLLRSLRLQDNFTKTLERRLQQ